MSYWEDVMIEGFGLEQRLASIPRRHVVSFGAGCSQHVIDHFLNLFKTDNWFELEEIDYSAIDIFEERWSEGLAACWEFAIGKPQGEGASAIRTALESLFESEDLYETVVDNGAPFTLELCGAVIRILQFMETSDVEFASGAAGVAFSAVSNWYPTPESGAKEGTAEGIRNSIASCVECRGEIEFQQSYFEVLETLPKSIHPTYENVRMRMCQGT